MFQINSETGAITMHRGDTGAFLVTAARDDEAAWTAADRLIWTVRSSTGDIVIQRYYRLDDDSGLGNGVVQVELHNDDTDDLAVGSYQLERRYVVNAYWDGDGTAPDGACVDALTAANQIVDGDIVRVPENGQSTLTLSTVYADV